METFPTSGKQLREWLSELRLAVFAVVVVLGMTFIMSFNLVAGSQVSVVQGQPAPNDIFSPRSLTYESRLRTDTARAQARNSISDTYTPLDLSIGRSQLGQANAVFGFIDTVRADEIALPEEKLDSVTAIEGIDLNADLGQDLLTMSPADYEKVKSEIRRIIDDLMREEIRVGEIDTFQRRAQRMGSLGLTTAQNSVVSGLAWQFIVPTVFRDEEATALARESAAGAVEAVQRSVAQDQRIVRDGEIVTADDIELLTELGLLRQEFDWQFVLGVFLISLLSVTLVVLYWQQFHARRYDNVRYLVILAALLLGFTIAAKAMTTAQDFWPYLFPISALAMLITVIFEARFAMLITGIVAAIFGILAPNSLDLMLYAAVGGLMALLTLRDAQRIGSFFRSGLLAGLGHVSVIVLFGLVTGSEILSFAPKIVYGIGNGLLSAALTLAMFFILGSVFGIITTLQLQDLSRLDHPLLQELLRRAPGTYHHSIMVANLAEQAAERVHANSALVRVGAFYHDIGKMNRPPFFVENQEGGTNPHDSLDPYTSARIIISHVSDGLVLAKRYKLPDRIRDFIAQHHGTRIVKAFYHKALAEADNDENEVNGQLFRYPGPRPQTKESGIVMLADAVEATSSALRPHSSAQIEKLVNSIVDEDIMEGQLVRSDLSLGDLEIIRASFIETLKGRFHVRIRYPGNEELEVLPAGQAPALPEPNEEATLTAPAVQQGVETVATRESTS